MTRKVVIAVCLALTIALSPAALAGTTVQATNNGQTAGDGLVVGSSHSTASDFENANQLDNLSISGSGDDASVTLESSADTAYTNDNTIYFQEGDGTITNTGVSGGVGDVGDFDGDGTMEAVYTSDNNELGLIEPSGDTTILATDAIVAGYVGDVDADGNDEATFRDSDNQFAFVDLDGSDRVNTTQDVYGVGGVGDFDDDGVIETALRDTGSNIVLREPDGTTTDTGVDAYRVGGGGDIDADGAPEIAIITSNDNEAAFVQADNSLTRTSVIDVTKIGGIGDLDGDGTKELMGLISGDVTTITASGSTTTLDSVETYDGVGGIGIVSPSVAEYESQPHVIDDGEAAAVNLTLSDVAATVEVTDSSGTVVVSETLSTTGNHTVQFGQTVDDPTVAISFDVTGDSPAATIHDESILFTNHAPEADNLSPPDGTELSQSSVDFSVDVSDAEFPTAQGDTVTAELFVDGSSVGTQTVTSNQSVTINHELTQGGDHTYHWELSDSYGATTSTSIRTVTVPAELEVWDVNNDTLIDQGNATVTFFGGENEQEIVEREVTNGTVSLAGLPTDTEFTVAVRADGYFTRQVIITSLYEQSRVWMLSKSVSDAVEVTFRLDDRTGEFANSDETQLRVQRPITINNSTEWRDVIGDDISATSDLATVLQNDQRYRLIIENDVQSRILGSYTPSGPADPEVIPIGRVNFQADTEAGTALDASLLNETSPAVRVMFRDPDQQATSLKYRITNTTEGANSTVVVANTTLSDPGAFTSVTEVLPQGTTLDDSTYLVELWAYQDGDLMEKQSVSVGQLSGPGDWTAGVNEGLLNLAGFVLIVSTGYGTANYKPELGALVAVIFGGALTLLNVVAIPHVILGFTGTIALIVNTADTT